MFQEQLREQGPVNVAREEVAMTNFRNEGQRWHVRGIRGFPVLMGVPGFMATWGHISETLHVICEGLVRTLLKFMVTQENKPHTFVKVRPDDRGGPLKWDHYDELQQTLRRVREIDHLPPSLREFSKWKGLDCMNFLLFLVTLLVSDDERITDTKVYTAFVYLANTTYYLHNDSTTIDCAALAQEHLEMFCEAYVNAVGESNCTFKFHQLQHMVLLRQIHGPAFLTDGFNYERCLGSVKGDTTTTRRQLLQSARNFMLRHQSRAFTDVGRLSEPVREWLLKAGIAKEGAALTKCGNGPMTAKLLIVEQDLTAAALQRFDECCVRELGMRHGELHFETLKRVSEFRRRHLTITSRHHRRKANVNEDNSWIAVGEEEFGQVVDILWLEDRHVALFDVRLYRKKVILTSTGDEMVYPVNSFPVEPTARMKTFALTDLLHIRKVMFATMRYDRSDDEHIVFGIRPNEWFRF